MTKDNMIFLLIHYREHKASLEIKITEKEKKQKLYNKEKEVITNMTSQYGINMDIHSKNKVSDKVLEEVIRREAENNILYEEIERLNEIIKDLTDKVNEVDIRLKGIYPKEAELIRSYYIDNETSEKMSNEKECSSRNIRKTIQKIIDKMIKL